MYNVIKFSTLIEKEFNIDDILMKIKGKINII